MLGHNAADDTHLPESEPESGRQRPGHWYQALSKAATHPLLRRQALALVLPAAAALLQWQLWPLLQPLAWFMFFPAMFLVCWLGNRAVSLASALLSVALVWWLFMPPIHSVHKSAGGYLSTAVFLALAGWFAQFHHHLRRALVKGAEMLAATEKANHELQISQRQLSELIELAPDGLFITNPAGSCIEVNSAACRSLGYARGQLLGKPLTDLLQPDDLPRYWAVLAKLGTGGVTVAEWRLRRADGTFLDCEMSATVLPDGRTQALMRDITERKCAEADLRQAAIVFQSTSEGIIITDACGNIVSVNSAFEAMSGYRRNELIGLNPRFQKSGRQDAQFYESMWQTLQADGQWRGEMWNRRKDGTVYPVWQNISTVRDKAGRITNYVSVFTDISAVKQAEARLNHLAHHDALTGLPNRLQLEDALHSAVERCRRSARRLAVLFIDLDNFKLINDSLGHAAGDELLKIMAARIQHCVRAEDTVARLGGDEFTVVLEEIAHATDAAEVAEKIIGAVRQPADVEGRILTCSASVGISVYPEDGEMPEALTRNADAALYRAKERGRNTREFYSPELTVRAAKRLGLEHDLRRALIRDELVLYYQPQWEAAGGRLCGLEALLRWCNPERGLVGPDSFIPVAEESELIEALGDWVIDRVCSQIQSWCNAGRRPVRTSFNVSGRQMLSGRLIKRMEAAIQTYHLSPRNWPLEVELTETVLVDAGPSCAVIGQLRDLGLTISIDDFGSGYSSLSMLQHLPVDRIKICQGLMQGLPSTADSRAIVSAVLGIGHALQKIVIAEGVEDSAQLEFLREHGCDEIQGHLFSEALPPERAVLLLH